MEFTKPLHDVEVKEKESAKFECEVSRESAKVFLTEIRVHRLWSQEVWDYQWAVPDLNFKFNAVVLITNYIISIAIFVKIWAKKFASFSEFRSIKNVFLKPQYAHKLWRYRVDWFITVCCTGPLVQRWCWDQKRQKVWDYCQGITAYSHHQQGSIWWWSRIWMWCKDIQILWNADSCR